MIQKIIKTSKDNPDLSLGTYVITKKLDDNKSFADNGSVIFVVTNDMIRDLTSDEELDIIKYLNKIS